MSRIAASAALRRGIDGARSRAGGDGEQRAELAAVAGDDLSSHAAISSPSVDAEDDLLEQA
jgi:hypothetical protein